MVCVCVYVLSSLAIISLYKIGLLCVPVCVLSWFMVCVCVCVCVCVFHLVGQSSRCKR